MKRNLIGLMLGLGLIFAVSADVFAQGRGRGGGGGNGNGRGNSGGQTTVTRGNSGNDNWGRSQNDRNNDSKNRINTNASNNRYKGLSRRTGMSTASLQKWYESERALNSDLTYGQFVAANMISRNHDGISAQTILNGLGSGRSIGQVLQEQGWNDGRIKTERKRIKKNASDNGYKDRDKDWKL